MSPDAAIPPRRPRRCSRSPESRRRPPRRRSGSATPPATSRRAKPAGVSVAADGTSAPGRSLQRVDGVGEAVLFTRRHRESGERLRGHRRLRTSVLRIGRRKGRDLRHPRREGGHRARVGTGRSLYAGASPGGKVYRIEERQGRPLLRHEGRSTSGLSRSTGNSLYVGTGLPGEIHRVKAAGSGRADPCDAGRARAVRSIAECRAASGPEPRARVWFCGSTARPDRDHLYDSGKPEVTAIVADRAGRVWAAVGNGGHVAGRTEPSAAPRSPPPRPAAAGVRRPGGRRGKNKPEVTVTSRRPGWRPPRGRPRGGYSRRSSSSRGASRRARSGRARRRSFSTWPRTRTGPASWRPPGPRRESSTPCPRIPRPWFGPSTRSRSPSSRATTSAPTPPARSTGGATARPGGIRLGGQGHRAHQPLRRFPLGGGRGAGRELEFAFRSGESAAPTRRGAPGRRW